MNARPLIDSLDFARNGQKISGEVPVAELRRLLDLLENSQGILSYTVRGGVDKQGIPSLDVSVAGNCRLRCQRCLNGMDYAVRLETRLLLRDQAALDALDCSVDGGEEEQFDSILADVHLDVLALLEEEILLSLPIAPRHESDACRVADAGNVPKAGNFPGSFGFGRLALPKEEKNPFAVLAKLKVVK